MENILDIYNKTNNFGRLINMTFDEVQSGHVIYRMPVSKNILATPTTAHGGAIAGFMDAIIGIAALSSVVNEQKLVSTVEYKINFIKPAMHNDELTGVGKVIQKGKRIIVSKGDIFNQNKDLIATALGTFNAYPFEKSDIFSSL